MIIDWKFSQYIFAWIDCISIKSNISVLAVAILSFYFIVFRKSQVDGQNERFQNLNFRFFSFLFTCWRPNIWEKRMNIKWTNFLKFYFFSLWKIRKLMCFIYVFIFIFFKYKITDDDYSLSLVNKARKIWFLKRNMP